MHKSINDKDIFKDHEDYFQIADNIRNIYMSEGSLLTLIDFERVLDELDLYAFKNWQIGELVSGPEISKYNVTCIFMWPESLMPDPRGARRLLPFDCKIKFKKTTMKVPIKITNPSDYIPGTRKAKISEKKVWLIEITMPKSLMNDIRTGSIDIEDEEVDLSDLDDAYDQDLNNDEVQALDQNEPAIQPQQGIQPPQPGGPTPPPVPF